jgi:negative regulator of flagellin synthesis FlgM
MKIGQTPDIPLNANAPVQSSQSKTGQSAAASATKGATSAGVAVTVSTLARTLDLAKTADNADFDTDKVNAVRTAIEQGTYEVNPEAIADKLLANAQEMLNRTRN